MNVYVHKHLAITLDDWTPVQDFMDENGITNFTALVLSSLKEKINNTNNCKI